MSKLNRMTERELINNREIASKPHVGDRQQETILKGGLLEDQLYGENKIRVSPKNKNVKNKLLENIIFTRCVTLSVRSLCRFVISGAR